MREPRIETLPLLPRPRRAQSLLSTTDISKRRNVCFDPHNLTRPCEHTIRAADTIEIVARDEDALRAANTTLDQLSRLCTRCHAFEIHDWAQFAHRGFMLDVSRDRIPTMEHLKSIVKLLAAMKFNHLQLYFEHTFAYSGHEQIWNGLDPMTAEHIHELDLLCTNHGIELAANQNCFGHLSHWLSHPDYAHLAETHDEYEFYGFRRQGPFSLNPGHPGSKALIRDWLAQLRACHTSQRVNIGCDEVADLGTGSSKALVQQLGYEHVYSQFVGGVADICSDIGFHPMFWADVALSHPRCLDRLPDNMTGLVWGYEPESPFAEGLDKLRARQMSAWICPGTSCWRSFAGRTTERLANIKAAAKIGSSYKCQGFLLTSWGDLGHRQQWPITLRALADGAAAAWSGEYLAEPSAVDIHVFDEPDSGLAAWLDALGDADLQLREARDAQNLPRLLNSSALFHELHPAHESMPIRGGITEWNEIRAILDELSNRVPTLNEPLIRTEVLHSLDCSRFACDTAIMRRGGQQAAGLDNIISQHKQLWRERSRFPGLAASTQHYTTLHSRLKHETTS
ncbi:MAG: hypothetical protein ED559_07645 [Phycisphaera sp.]|nr:MAG: hypothetical protein ED559_07645 [Phycisphaera sp.]